MNDEAKDRLMAVEAIQKLSELSRKILDADVEAEHLWFRNLLLGILNSATLDYRSVEVGVKKSLYLAAWGTRNLLELRIVTGYVLASNANAIDFRSDLLRDAAEFFDAVSKRLSASHAKFLSLFAETAGQQEGPVKEALEEFHRKESERKLKV